MQSIPLRTSLIFSFCAAIALGAIGTAIAANADQVEQLLSTKKCALCDLSDAQLGGKQLAGADLSGANLSNAILYGTNLRGAKLAGAVLNGANLKAADLSGETDAALAGSATDDRTICPSGAVGPCQ